jgi:hypothetical protein
MSITVETINGTLTFPDQASYEAWIANPTSVSIGANGEVNVSPTNASSSDAASASKIANAGIVGDTATGSAATASATPTDPTAGNPEAAGGYGGTNGSALPPGAIPVPQTLPGVTVVGKKSNRLPDTRVRILVPEYYLKTTTVGLSKELGIDNIGGIVFPYTPQIAFDHKADYAEQRVMHTNYAMHFYQRSYVTPITITGKFTVQNDKDAGVYIATLHLLRALTKMQFGGENTTYPDQVSGSPPPICRLLAYGDYMLDNVPITISNLRIELPGDVDYYTLGNRARNSTYGSTTVPVISTIAITCIPMYSRAEMQKFSINGWINSDLRKKGYL